MKKFFIQFILLCLVIFGAIYLVYNPSIIGSDLRLLPSSDYDSSTPDVGQTQVKVGNVVVDIEVADTASKRSQGLSGKESLAANQGMLFVFPTEKKYQLWMKGMNFNLDMVFIRKGKVVDIISNVPAPASDTKDADLPIYEPVEAVDMLLEVNAGFAAKNGIKVGDAVLLVK